MGLLAGIGARRSHSPPFLELAALIVSENTMRANPVSSATLVAFLVSYEGAGAGNQRNLGIAKFSNRFQFLPGLIESCDVGHREV